MSTYLNVSYLAEADWLHTHLEDPNLCVIDARYDVRVNADGRFQEISGRAGYLKGHIKGAQFVDLKEDLTDAKSPAHRRGGQD